MWKKLEEQIIRPKVERGVDWSGVRRVMARKGTREVWWRPGYSCWAGRGSQEYNKSSLVLSEGEDRLGWPVSRNLFEGRFSPAKLQEHLEAIAKHLGVPLSKLPALHPKATFVWEDD